MVTGGSSRGRRMLRSTSWASESEMTLPVSEA